VTLVDIDAPMKVRRNGRGQYLVVPPNGKKPIGYMRATSIPKALSDEGNLINWSSRMTAIGLAKSPHLVAEVALADPGDKKTLDALTEKAKEAGGATVRRDLGTAIHTMLEKSHIDPTWEVPEPYTADVAAINAAIDAAGYDVVAEYSESILVLDEYRIAGMCDLVLRHRSTGELVIADLKTGSSTAYGAGEWATQLYIYASADAVYRQGAAADGSEDERLPMPKVSAERAIILHCQPQSGHCDAYHLDLEVGKAGFDLAMKVREWRKAKPLSPLTDSSPEGSEGTAADAGEPSGDAPTRVAWLIERADALKAAGHAHQMAERWPDDCPRPADVRHGLAAWTDGQQDAVAACLDAVEALVEAPFGAPDPTTPKPEPKVKVVAKVTPLPEVADGDVWADDDLVTGLRSLLLSMLNGDDNAKARYVTTWLKDGQRQSRPWAMGDPAKGERTSLRRFAIAAAALELVDLVDPEAEFPDAQVRAALAAVLGDDVVQPVYRTGGLLGCLTAEQAEQLAKVAATWPVTK
jgi:hypothetical protein